MSDSSRYVSGVGSFRCRVKAPGNGWFGEMGENKTPFIRIPLIVLDEGDQEGKEIVWFGWLTDAAFDRTIQTLVKAFPDWDGDMLALRDGTFTFADLECEIVTESETYKGKPRIKVVWLNPLGGGGGDKAMESSKLDSLLGKLGRKAKAIAKEAKGGAAGSSRPAATTARTSGKTSLPPPPDDDNLPY